MIESSASGIQTPSPPPRNFSDNITLKSVQTGTLLHRFQLLSQFSPPHRTLHMWNMRNPHSEISESNGNSHPSKQLVLHASVNHIRSTLLNVPEPTAKVMLAQRKGSQQHFFEKCTSTVLHRSNDRCGFSGTSRVQQSKRQLHQLVKHERVHKCMRV